MLATPTTIQSVGEGADFDVVKGIWREPKTISPEDVAECHRFLRAHDAATKVPPPRCDDMLEQWLLKLLGGLSTRMSEGEVKMKLNAYSFILAGLPAYCYDDQSLSIAMMKFRKFIPAAGDLREHLNDYVADTNIKVQRALRLSDLGARKHTPAEGENPAQDPDWQGWRGGKNEAEAYGEKLRAKQRRDLAELAALKQVSDEPKQKADEGDKAFVARLCEWNRQRLDAVTKGKDPTNRTTAKAEDDKRRYRPAEPKQIAVAARIMAENPNPNLPKRADIQQRATVAAEAGDD